MRLRMPQVVFTTLEHIAKWTYIAEIGTSCRKLLSRVAGALTSGLWCVQLGLGFAVFILFVRRNKHIIIEFPDEHLQSRMNQSNS